MACKEPEVVPVLESSRRVVVTLHTGLVRCWTVARRHTQVRLGVVLELQMQAEQVTAGLRVEAVEEPQPQLAIDAFLRAHGDMADFYAAVGETGQCAVCGRTLTDPLSQARGIGPECIQGLVAQFFGIAAVAEARAADVQARRAARKATT